MSNKTEGDLIEQTEPNNKKSKSSWIWNYWEEKIQEFRGELCQVIVCKVVDNSEQIPCGKIYVKSNGSTGNAIINYLRNQHDITKDGKINKSNNSVKQNDDVAQKHYYSEKRQQELRQFLVDWIIDDIQPINIVRNPKFRQLIFQLDPAFILPCSETVKAIVHTAFNFSFSNLLQIINSQAKSVSLTLDLWTSKSRQGYLGITCSFLNNTFDLHEFTLDIAYIRYPHTSN